jgi:CTP:molybdopterin cytidylyltransferase MocA
MPCPAVEAGVAVIVVVLGAFSEVRGSRKLQGCRVAVNDAWKDGVAGSIRAGIGELGAIEGVIVLTCDMPFVTAPHLSVLAARDAERHRIMQAIGVYRHSYIPQNHLRSSMKPAAEAGLVPCPMPASTYMRDQI